MFARYGVIAAAIASLVLTAGGGVAASGAELSVAASGPWTSSVGVIPTSVAPGGEVEVKLHFCNAPKAVELATSSVFTEPARLTNTGIIEKPVILASTPLYAGHATISRTAKPGRATVTTQCRGTMGSPTQTADLTILPVPVNVVPASGRRGQKVTVQVDCDKAGGAVSSAALTAGTLRPNPDGHQPWAMSASGTVNPNARPGTYRVSAVCGDRTLDGTFSVLKPQVSQKPTGPVQTGGGGTAS